MEIFHELSGHRPEFLVSESTPAPVVFTAKLGPNVITQNCVFLHRFEPFAVPRASKLIWTFGCN